MSFQIFGSTPLWLASKNQSHRRALTALVLSLHSFLKDHGLYLSPERVVSDPSVFSLHRDDLTEDGFLFLWRYQDGYLGHLDRVGRTDHREYLEACSRQFVKRP